MPQTIAFLCLSVVVLLFAPAHASPLLIEVHALSAKPTLDGDASEWAQLSGYTIPLRNTQADSTIQIDSVSLKAGYFGESVYFCAVWSDSTESLIHKPFIWDDTTGSYKQGPQREDRFALQFAISGDYDTDWLSGNIFSADMWHWKAARSNPNGKADDKYTRISREKLMRAYTALGKDGLPLYILRDWDAGDQGYVTRRYYHKQQAIMPKYILNPPGQGSSMDIDARGVWHNGQWTLELSRRLDTGHSDDVRFAPGEQVKGGIAIFDQSENSEHAISEVLVFQFQ